MSLPLQARRAILQLSGELGSCGPERSGGTHVAHCDLPASVYLSAPSCHFAFLTPSVSPTTLLRPLPPIISITDVFLISFSLSQSLGPLPWDVGIFVSLTFSFCLSHTQHIYLFLTSFSLLYVFKNVICNISDTQDTTPKTHSPS